MKLNTWCYMVREAGGNVRRNTLMSTASVCIVAVSLFVLSVFVLLALNVNYLAATLESQVQIQVFLSRSLSTAQTAALRQQVAAVPGVRAVSYISAQAALTQLKREFGRQQDLLSAVEQHNPLRPSLAVQTVNPHQVGAVAAKLKGFQGVRKVTYKAAVVRRLFQVADALHRGGLILAGLLCLATIFIVANSVRLTVFARRHEIGIMKLVGATDALIRWPFLLEGMILGVVGSLIATGVLWESYRLLEQGVQRTIPFLPMLPSYPLMGELAVSLAALGALIGVLGSSLSLRRYLRV